MTTFLAVSLYFLAFCAVLGGLPPAVLAAKARQPGSVLAAVLIAAFVIFVLVTAAGRVR